MPRFEHSTTPLAGLLQITRLPLNDARGEFERLFCSEELADLGFAQAPLQINRSLTRAKGAVRGMHFQYPPHAEIKLVSCLRGEVFDVAVDVRRDSATFLQWFGCVLTESNHRSLLIPEGFAHGFQTLSDNAELLYCHSAAYQPAAEGGLHPLDPRLAIAWPLPVGDMSARDSAHPALPPDFAGVAL
jgi:dTDP-4-dehydrorhamnose 3,5-epimerase